MLLLSRVSYFISYSAISADDEQRMDWRTSIRSLSGHRLNHASFWAPFDPVIYAFQRLSAISQLEELVVYEGAIK